MGLGEFELDFKRIQLITVCSKRFDSPSQNKKHKNQSIQTKRVRQCFQLKASI